jgi:uncharacterized membrane protein (DUF2068 family)
VSVYAAAFGLLVAAGAVFAYATFGQLESLGLLRVSAWLSGAAIVVALVSVVLPRRS